jgi:hypothetical protein
MDWGSTWQSTSPQYCQPHEEWEEDLDNDEVEQTIPRYANIVLQIKYLEE